MRCIHLIESARELTEVLSTVRVIIEPPVQTVQQTYKAVPAHYGSWSHGRMSNPAFGYLGKIPIPTRASAIAKLQYCIPRFARCHLLRVLKLHRHRSGYVLDNNEHSRIDIDNVDILTSISTVDLESSEFIV